MLNVRHHFLHARDFAETMLIRIQLHNEQSSDPYSSEVVDFYKQQLEILDSISEKLYEIERVLPDDCYLELDDMETECLNSRLSYSYQE